MKYIVCTIHDVKAGAYLQPFFSVNDNVAVRDFSTVINDATTKLSQYPSDYTLFKIAEFDDTTGQFDIVDKVSLGNGVEFKNVELVEESSSGE